MNTLDNVQSMTAIELLADWDNGSGKTSVAVEAGKFDHVQDGHLLGVPVSLALLTAIAEKELAAKSVSPSLIEALKKGCLSINHLQQYKVESSTTTVSRTVAGKALEKSGQLRTSSEFLRDAVSYATIDKVRLTEVIARIIELQVSSSTDLNDMGELLSEVVSIFTTATQRATYTAKLSDERNAATKMQELTELGMTDIKRTTSGYSGLVSQDIKLSIVLSTLHHLGYEQTVISIVGDNVCIEFIAIEA